MQIGQREAEETMRALAKVEGIFAGAQNMQRSCLNNALSPAKQDMSSARSTASALRLQHWRTF